MLPYICDSLQGISYLLCSIQFVKVHIVFLLVRATWGNFLRVVQPIHIYTVRIYVYMFAWPGGAMFVTAGGGGPGLSCNISLTCGSRVYCLIMFARNLLLACWSTCAAIDECVPTMMHWHTVHQSLYVLAVTCMPVHHVGLHTTAGLLYCIYF
jgi:hypothetical protein